MSWEIERRGHVAIVTMNTNRANVQNPDFFDHLHRAFDRLDAEFADCAIVLTGQGKIFSAGLDLDFHLPFFAERSAAELNGWFQAYRATNLRLFTCPRPTIAAINGHTWAGGMITALCCDLRVAADGGAEFALPGATIGMAVPAVFVEIIKHAIGAATANEMLLAARVYDIEAALQRRIVHEAVAPGELIDRAVAVAERVTPDCFAAYGYAKQALQAQTLAAIEAAEHLDAAGLAEAMSSPGSLRAHAQRYRELKGKEPHWTVPE